MVAQTAEASPSAVAATAPPDVLAAYVDAYNADDVDGVMASFREDGVIAEWTFAPDPHPALSGSHGGRSRDTEHRLRRPVG